ncbi:MAG: 3'-5' exonuclease [Proteobacteria bacterium]|nr:3'-5' exonuclease [Pseudomonadota bacterium]
MKPAVVLDLETTGFPSNKGGFCARIVEVGAVVVTEDARVVSPISFFVRQPSSHLTQWQAQKALSVSGIRVDTVLREGLDPHEAAPRLARWMAKVTERFGVQEVRAYNQSFDFWFLERSPWDLFERTGLARGEDIKATAKRVMQTKSGPALKDAVAFANASGGQIHWQSAAHRAEEDARMAAMMAVFFGGSESAQ